MTPRRLLPAAAALACLLPAGPAVAQGDTALPAEWRHWRHVAPVRVPDLDGPRLVRVRVPEDVSRGALAEWADLRVIDDGGREVAFALYARTGSRSRERREARLLDVTHRPGGDTRAVVDLGPEPAGHNAIEIGTPLREFFARVSVDASGDASEWRILDEGAPIYRFAERGLEGNQTVRYGDSRSRYLRLRITDGPERFPLEAAGVWHEVTREAERVPVDVRVEPDASAPPGESWWTADAGAPGQPVSRVAAAVSRETFHRPVRVRAGDDGASWRTVGTGEIYRMPRGSDVRQRLHVTFPESRARFLRVEIVNRDDPPLERLTLRLEGTPRYVVFRAEPGRDYRLLYGNARAAAPEYELSRVTPSESLEAALPAELGPSVVNAAYADPAPWTERHPVILWSAVIAALGVLGFLALRALREPAVS